MATTGELQAIIKDLELIDIGDAASYLGEEALLEDEAVVSEQQESVSGSPATFYSDYAHSS